MNEPVFRFWGSRDPQGREKPAIRAEAPVSEGGDDGTAVLRLYDPIDSWGGYWGVSASEFAAVLDGLPAGTTNIRLHINSPGGEVFEAVAILNQLRRHSARVTAVVDGLAASAASVLAAGADETVMGQNSTLMIHDAWGIAVGPASDVRDMADLLDKLSQNLANVYAAKAGTPVEEWRAAMIATTWYTAEEAVAAGLADSVQGAEPARGKGEHGPAADWDLTIYNRGDDPGALEQAQAPQPEPAPDPARAKLDFGGIAEVLKGAFA